MFPEYKKYFESEKEMENLYCFLAAYASLDLQNGYYASVPGLEMEIKMKAHISPKMVEYPVHFLEGDDGVAHMYRLPLEVRVNNGNGWIKVFHSDGKRHQFYHYASDNYPLPWLLLFEHNMMHIRKDGDRRDI